MKPITVQQDYNCLLLQGYYRIFFYFTLYVQCVLNVHTQPGHEIVYVRKCFILVSSNMSKIVFPFNELAVLEAKKYPSDDERPGYTDLFCSGMT